MAESVLVGLRAASSCGSCGKKIAADLTSPAIFCRECGCCLLTSTHDTSHAGVLQPFVPPRVEMDAAWSRLKAAEVEASVARLTGGRLLFVPFHEWAPDLSKRRLVKDARALLAPAADLLPSGFRAPVSSLGDGVRGLAIAERAHKGRLADPSGALPLIRGGEAVDVMIPPPDRIPEGADPGAPRRLLYYPFWFLTYRIDWTERRGVVDAATGDPVGPSSSPRRWLPAALGAAAGCAAFILISMVLKPLERPVIEVLVAAVGACAVAAVALARHIGRERGR